MKDPSKITEILYSFAYDTIKQEHTKKT